MLDGNVMKRRLALTALGALLMTAAACAPAMHSLNHGDETVVERSAKKRPEWITQLPSDQSSFYATGFATGSATLDEGKARAMRAAIEEVVNYLGIQAEVYYDETRTELTTRLVNRITAEGLGRVARGRPVEMYFERMQSYSHDGPSDRFDVYILLRIPWPIIREEEQRLTAERQARTELAARLLDEGRARAHTGDISGALRRWIEAGRLLEGEQSARIGVHEIEAAVSDLVSSVALIVEDDEKNDGSESGDESDASRADEERKVRAVLRMGDRSIPLPWLPLNLSLGGNASRVFDRITTNEEGIAQVTLPRVHGGSRGTAAKAALTVDVERLLALDPTTKDLPGRMVATLRPLEVLSVWIPLPKDTYSRPDDDRPLAISDAPVTPIGPEYDFSMQTTTPDARASRDDMVPRGDAPFVEGSLRIRIAPTTTTFSFANSSGTDSVGYLVDIQPSSAWLPARRPLNLALVLDRSGSMADAGKLEYVKRAVRLVMRNLGPEDQVTVVVYSDESKVLLEAGSHRDRLLIDHHLSMIDAMGVTNLSAGLFEAVNILSDHFLEGGINRAILLTDGLANQGVTNREALSKYAEITSQKGISISTIGLGQDFDEDMLLAIAFSGRGNSYYVDDQDKLPDVFLKELHELSAMVAQNLTLTLELEPGADFLDSYGWPHEQDGSLVRFPLSSIAAGVRNLSGFTIRPPRRGNGSHRIGTLEIQYDDVTGVPRRVRQTVPLQLTFVSSSDAGTGENPRVARYIKTLATMDVMLLAEKSGDADTIRKTLEFMESELDDVTRWATRLDDPEMASLAEVYEHCIMSLKHLLEHPGSHHEKIARDTRKEIQYKLYQLRRQPAHLSDHEDTANGETRRFPRRLSP